MSGTARSSPRCAAWPGISRPTARDDRPGGAAGCAPDEEVLFRASGETSRRRTSSPTPPGWRPSCPRRTYVFNLCQDRYWFTVALAAGLLRGQASLLTSDPSPERLRGSGATIRRGCRGGGRGGDQQPAAPLLDRPRLAGRPAGPMRSPDARRRSAGGDRVHLGQHRRAGRQPRRPGARWPPAASPAGGASACAAEARSRSWAPCRRGTCTGSRRRSCCRSMPRAPAGARRSSTRPTCGRRCRGAGAARAGDDAAAAARPAAGAALPAARPRHFGDRAARSGAGRRGRAALGNPRCSRFSARPRSARSPAAAPSPRPTGRPMTACACKRRRAACG